MPRLLTAVMDVATNKVEKFAYKPWGMRRNPANWAAEVVNDYPARFSRGYCMHEHLSNLGLINMGGRVYNARTNQFIARVGFANRIMSSLYSPIKHSIYDRMNERSLYRVPCRLGLEAIP